MVLAILLPHVSNEYKLIYVYLIWAAFLLFLLEDVARVRVTIAPAAIYMIMLSCAVISVPLNYFGVPIGASQIAAFGGQIKTVFLLLILITAIRFPMPSSLFGDLRTPAIG